MLSGGFASGSALPPVIIYPKSFPGNQCPDDAVCARNESAWVDTELSIEWMKHIPLRYTALECPVLVLIDDGLTYYIGVH